MPVPRAVLLCLALPGCAWVEVDPNGLAPFVLNVALTHIDNYADQRSAYPRPDVPFVAVGRWRLSSSWQLSHAEDALPNHPQPGASAAVPRVRLRLRRRSFLFELIWRF